MSKLAIDAMIDLWSMRPQPGTETGLAWESGCRQGYKWGALSSAPEQPAGPAATRVVSIPGKSAEQSLADQRVAAAQAPNDTLHSGIQAEGKPALTAATPLNRTGVESMREGLLSNYPNPTPHNISCINELCDQALLAIDQEERIAQLEEDVRRRSKQYNELAERAEQAERKFPQWISARERMPEIGEVVLALRDIDDIWTAYFDGQEWISPEENQPLREFSYWMPLPAPPAGPVATQDCRVEPTAAMPPLVVSEPAPAAALPLNRTGVESMREGLLFNYPNPTPHNISCINELCDQALRALDQPGWVRVPVEPTAGMIHAGNSAMASKYGAVHTVRGVYEAMIAAAPPAAAQVVKSDAPKSREQTCEPASAAATPRTEVRFKVGDQWYYRGNRSPAWFAVASRADGSCQNGISERVECRDWPLLEALARYESVQMPEDPRVFYFTVTLSRYKDGILQETIKHSDMLSTSSEPVVLYSDYAALRDYFAGRKEHLVLVRKVFTI